MERDKQKYQSRKSLLVEAYNKHKYSKNVFYEDDFFIYDMEDAKFAEILRSLEKKLRMVASLPTIIVAAFLAYLGLRA